MQDALTYSQKLDLPYSTLEVCDLGVNYLLAMSDMCRIRENSLLHQSPDMNMKTKRILH